jgi:hypothetical protein
MKIVVIWHMTPCIHWIIRSKYKNAVGTNAQYPTLNAKSPKMYGYFSGNIRTNMINITQ